MDGERGSRSSNRPIHGASSGRSRPFPPNGCTFSTCRRALLQIRCRCSNGRSTTQLLIATGGGLRVGTGWRRLLGHMYRGAVVGVEPSPPWQMIEQHHGRGLGAEQGPGDVVFREQARQLVARNRHRLGIAFDKDVAVEVAAVDERLGASEAQVTAKGI